MLETIWFLLWGLLWAIYFMLDGYDLGLGTVMPFMAKSDKEIRTVYNAMGPFWDGNEVWLITAGGVTFAAFPTTYATMFSTLYSPLLLLLFGLILRAVSFEFRGQLESAGWRKLWDTCLFLGSFVPALLLGVAFANIFHGIPFDGKGVFHGTLLTLLNPYGLVGGVLFVVMFVTHGLIWLALKTEGPLHDRAASTAGTIWVVLLVVTVVFLVHSWFATHLYANYLAHPSLFLILVAAVVGLVLARLFMAKQGMVERLVLLMPFHRVRDAFRGNRAFPEPLPIQPRPRVQPDRVQFCVQSDDPEDHAGGRADFRSYRDRVPGMGVLSVQTQGYGRNALLGRVVLNRQCNGMVS